MFRFTIRDLLWLMVVVGLAVGWWIDRREIVRERESLVMKQQEIEALEENARKSLHDLSKFEYAVRERLAPLMQQQLTGDELNAINERAKQLGAPLPQPLPLGYGERPN
jgi:hypothetical protein